MKKLIICVCVFVLSCQKEVSQENVNPVCKCIVSAKGFVFIGADKFYTLQIQCDIKSYTFLTDSIESNKYELRKCFNF